MMLLLDAVEAASMPIVRHTSCRLAPMLSLFLTVFSFPGSPVTTNYNSDSDFYIMSLTDLMFIIAFMLTISMIPHTTSHPAILTLFVYCWTCWLPTELHVRICVHMYRTCSDILLQPSALPRRPHLPPRRHRRPNSTLAHSMQLWSLPHVSSRLKRLIILRNPLSYGFGRPTPTLKGGGPPPHTPTTTDPPQPPPVPPNPHDIYPQVLVPSPLCAPSSFPPLPFPLSPETLTALCDPYQSTTRPLVEMIASLANAHQHNAFNSLSPSSPSPFIYVHQPLVANTSSCTPLTNPMRTSPCPSTAQIIIVPIHLPDHFTLAVYCISLSSSPILFHIDSARSSDYKDLLTRLSPHILQLLRFLLPHHSLPDLDPVFLSNFPLQTQDLNCALHVTRNILYILRLFHTVPNDEFLTTLTSLEVPPIDYSLFRTFLYAHLTRTPLSIDDALLHATTYVSSPDSTNANTSNAHNPDSYTTTLNASTNVPGNTSSTQMLILFFLARHHSAHADLLHV